jgi:integrase/recombinase XerD
MGSEKKASVLSEQEFRRAVAMARSSAHATRNVALLYCSFALGLRAKELSNIKVKDVLLSSGDLREEVLLTRSTTKGGKQRLVYLSNRDLRKALTLYLTERSGGQLVKLAPDAALFKSAKGGGFSPNTMQMLFKKLYLAAGLESASSHSGRRTFATSLIERGADIKAVSKLMGHASVAMTARYIDDNPARLRKICAEVILGV